MYIAPSFRFAGDSVRLAGLELEDWSAVAVALLAGVLILPHIFGDAPGRFAAVGIALATGVVLRQVKRGKPRGYLKYRLHRAGGSLLVPRHMRPRILVPIRPGLALTIFRGIDPAKPTPFAAGPSPAGGAVARRKYAVEPLP